MLRQERTFMRRLLVVLMAAWLPCLLGFDAGRIAVARTVAASSVQAAPASEAASQKLPTVEWVLERYVMATGGREALLRHESMTVRGRNYEPATRREVSGVFYTKGGKFLQVVTLPGGKSLSGYDGHTAWDLDSHGKVTIQQGDVVKSVARDADMYYHLHVMQYFRSMEVVDVQTVNGRSCYHLKGVNSWGRQNEQFYDKETGLLVGYAFNTAWRGGNGAATQLFDEYRDFAGVRMPTKTTTRDGDDVSVFTIASVTWDDVPDSAFGLPAAVRAKLLACVFGLGLPLASAARLVKNRRACRHRSSSLPKSCRRLVRMPAQSVSCPGQSPARSSAR
jgi:hypothetical protein